MTGDQSASTAPPWAYALIVVVFLVCGLFTSRAGHIQYGSAETTFPIIAFEVAGSGERAERILTEAVESLAAGEGDRPEAREAVEVSVRRSLWWDFGFIAGYSLSIFVLAPALGRRLQTKSWRRLGAVIGWTGLVAGTLDVIENISLLRVLEDTSHNTWAQVAAIVSWGKWILVVGAVAYGLGGLIHLAVRTVTRGRLDHA